MRTTKFLTLMSAGAVIVTTVVAVVLFALQRQPDAAAESPNVPVSADTTTTTAPPTTVAPRPEPVSTTLRPDDKGPEVLALQQRLRSLGYWLGVPDSTYGGLTVQAVTAFQKVEGIGRDGIAGPATTTALDRASRPEAASASGDLIEIDKARQVLFVVHGYHDVPAYPASHGCVRVSNAAMDWIWSEGLMPIDSLVWVS